MLAPAQTQSLPGACLGYAKIYLQCIDAVVNALDSAISRTVRHVVVKDVMSAVVS